MELVERLLKGDQRAASRLITLIEGGGRKAREAIKEIYPHTGGAHIIGITGPSGVGKSTLVSCLVQRYRDLDRTIGVIAVDPTSPFTGGALLGDRIRMGAVSTDPHVFIRSMGTRGQMGGLARATNDAVKVLDAFGKDKVIVETVGAGQSEVDIVRSSDTTIVVEMPGLGDDIQAFKAGIMEIGDIFVVNKADRMGADHLMNELETMLNLNPKTPAWRPMIKKTVSRTGEGVEDLVDAIEEHHGFLKSSGELEKKERQRCQRELTTNLQELLNQKVEDKIGKEDFKGAVERIVERSIDPHSAARELLSPILGGL